MTVSREEAVFILKKWNNESTPILVAFVAGGFALIFSGSMRAVTEDGAVVSRSGAAIDGLMTFALDPIEAFEYGDYREASPPVQAALVAAKDKITAYLSLKSGLAMCLLCERARDV